jgi:LacI family transcriptional regulator
VACDNELIGKLAAEHLLGCRLRHFAYVSELAWEDERRRCRAFADAVRAAGCDCEVIQLPFHEELAADASARYRVDVVQLGHALQGLSLPVGVCVPNSVAARIVSDVAQECGLDVPDQVAVLGVNDDPLVCESTNPHLSAVVQPSEQIGLEAARRLDALMSGAERKPTTTYLPPQGIAARQSTDTLAIADVAVRSALRFIRAHAAEPIEVADVIEAAGVSRRTLETRFRRLLGRTPAFELRRVRMQLAKRLLAETNEPITNIVYASGFNSRQVFCALFRKETGASPTAYRRRFQSEVLGGKG